VTWEYRQERWWSLLTAVLATQLKLVPSSLIITDYNVAFLTDAFSALTLLVWWQEGHLAFKKLSGGMLVWLCVWVKMEICIWPS